MRKIILVLLSAMLGLSVFAQVKLDLGTTNSINDFDTYDNYTHGWLVGEGGLMMATHSKAVDGGPVMTGTTEDLTGVRFFDENYGVIAGDNGFLAKTDDGGNTWTPITEVPFAFNGNITDVLTTENDTVIYVTVGNGTNAIFKSMDLGKTWEHLYTVGNASSVVSLASNSDDKFVTSYYATSKNDYVTWTTNKWASVTKETYDRSTYEVVAPAANDKYWSISKGADQVLLLTGNANDRTVINESKADWNAVCNFGDDTVVVGGLNGKLYISVDSGATWQDVSYGTEEIRDIKCAPNNSRLGILIGDEKVMKTTDGGMTWTEFYDDPAGGCSGGSMRMADFIDNDTIAVLWHSSSCNGDGAYHIFKFTDLNDNSQVVDKYRVRSGCSPQEISVGDANTYFTISTGVATKKSGFDRCLDAADSLRTWEMFDGPSTSDATALEVMPYNSDIVLLGYSNGQIYISTDATNPTPTWSLLTTITGGAQVEEISYDAGNQTLWAVGGGYVLRSTDYAGNWSTFDAWEVDASATFKAVSAEGDMVTIAGSPIKAYISVNGNDATPSWTSFLPDPTLGQLTYITGVPGSETEAYVVGEAGLIIATDDASNFSYIADPLIKDNYTSVTAQNRDSVFAVSAEGNCVFSYDSGQTWMSVAVGALDLVDVAVADGKVVAVGALGEILISEDAGATWAPAISAGMNPGLKAVWMVGKDTIYATGNNSTFLRSFDGGISWENPMRIILQNKIVGVAKDNKSMYIVDETGLILGTNDTAQTFTLMGEISDSIVDFDAEDTGKDTDFSNDYVFATAVASDSSKAIWRRKSNTTIESIAIPGEVNKNININDIYVRDQNWVIAAADSAILFWYQNADNKTAAGDVQLKVLRLDTIITGFDAGTSLRAAYIDPSNTSKFTVIADGGLILNTTDRGVNWTVDTVSAIGTDTVLVAERGANPRAFVGRNGLFVYPALALDLDSVSPSVVCAGDPIDVYYTVSQLTYDSGNEFILEISDENGDFTSPTEIARQSGTASGAFMAVDPLTTTAGMGYLLRIVATAPVDTAWIMGPFEIRVLPVPMFSFVESTPGTISFTNESTGATSYSWDFGDGTGTSTDTDPSYAYPNNNVYSVVLTASDGTCEDTYSDNVSTTVSVGTNVESTIKVYPNPTSGNLNISLPADEVISVFDAQGKSVFTVNGTAGDNSITLDAGVYMVKIGTFTEIVVVE